ncbi:MAG TPA: hypothetical protein DCE11_01400 [Ruminiclostridium sp.]|nr:hypothetical protein [Ruminiclostridium sp.]
MPLYENIGPTRLSSIPVGFDALKPFRKPVNGETKAVVDKNRGSGYNVVCWFFGVGRGKAGGMLCE